jgi:hypothetical protein
VKQQTKQFELLKKKWYAKLKRAGFVDIEQDEDSLTNWSSSRFLRGKNRNKALEDVMDYNLSKQEYYRLVGHFLHDHKFENKVDKLIWELHSEAISYRKIVSKLKHKGIDTNTMRIFHAITRLKTIMIERYKNYE